MNTEYNVVLRRDFPGCTICYSHLFVLTYNHDNAFDIDFFIESCSDRDYGPYSLQLGANAAVFAILTCNTILSLRNEHQLSFRLFLIDEGS